MRLIISDIDGTLLDQSGGLPPENIAALAAAALLAAPLALASIRKRDSSEQIARQLGVPRALGCDGVAMIYDERGEELPSIGSPPHLARRIAAEAT